MTCSLTYTGAHLTFLFAYTFVCIRILGDQISIVDLHLGPWLARVASLCDGLHTDSGDTIIAKIESRIGDGFVLPKNYQSVISPDLAVDPSQEITPGAKRVKLAAFWDEMKERPSWKKVYADNLH